MLVLDDAGTVVHVNPAAAKLLGISVGELVGRTFPHPVSAGAPVEIEIDHRDGTHGVADIQSLPVAALKLDRDLVAGVEEGRGSALVGATVALAHALDIRVVAECVETDAQRAALRELGCDAAQGFVVSAPLAADEAADLLPA